MDSSRNGNVCIVEAYINAGMDKEWFGPALYVGSEQGHLEIVNALVSGKADVNYRHNLHGETALRASCRNGRADIASVLRYAGAREADE